MRVRSVLRGFVDMACQNIVLSHVFKTKVVPNHVFYLVFFKFDAKGAFEPPFCSFFVLVSLCWCFVAFLGTPWGPVWPKPHVFTDKNGLPGPALGALRGALSGQAVRKPRIFMCKTEHSFA